VGNLNEDVEPEHLRSLFQAHGEPERTIVPPPRSVCVCGWVWPDVKRPGDEEHGHRAQEGLRVRRDADQGAGRRGQGAARRNQLPRAVPPHRLVPPGQARGAPLPCPLRRQAAS
jgi:hypothetical protein